MAKTVVLDGVLVKRLAVARSAGGSLEVSCEYDLLSGGQPVQAKFVTLDAQQAAAWQTPLMSVFTGITQQVAQTELS